MGHAEMSRVNIPQTSNASLVAQVQHTDRHSQKTSTVCHSRDIEHLAIPEVLHALVSQNLIHGGSGIVGHSRKKLTVHLAALALRLEGGDFAETGVYAGLCTVILLKVLQGFDSTCTRRMYAYDSFDGLPPPSAQDQGVGAQGEYKASFHEFKENLVGAHVYDEDRLRVEKGWFKDTCSVSPVKQISFLRLDGDLYQSTMDALVGLYDRVMEGGLIYVDDYGSFPGCRAAISQFRLERGIKSRMHMVAEDGNRNCFEAVAWSKGDFDRIDAVMFPILGEIHNVCR